MTATPSAAARVHLVRVQARDVAPGEAWLTDAEQTVAEGFRVPGRLADWRLGRWAAKHAVMACAAGEGIQVGPPDIEVLAQPGGAPAARIMNGCVGVRAKVSISHRGGVGLAAASLAEIAVGCDVERVERRSDAFVADYFTPCEREWISGLAAPDRDAAVMLTWSAKEAALKALGEGLRLDTRAVVVEAGCGASRTHGERIQLRVRGPWGRVFSGCAWLEPDWVTTMVAEVGAAGLEPATSWSQTTRATNCATPREAAES